MIWNSFEDIVVHYSTAVGGGSEIPEGERGNPLRERGRVSRSESRKSFFRSTERAGEFRVIIGGATLPQDIASSSVWSFPTPVHPTQCVNNPNSHPLDFFPFGGTPCVSVYQICVLCECVCVCV